MQRFASDNTRLPFTRGYFSLSISKAGMYIYLYIYVPEYRYSNGFLWMLSGMFITSSSIEIRNEMHTILSQSVSHLNPEDEVFASSISVQDYPTKIV